MMIIMINCMAYYIACYTLYRQSLALPAHDHLRAVLWLTQGIIASMACFKVVSAEGVACIVDHLPLLQRE